MGLLQVIEDAPGFLKSTFQGPQGSGKSRTAVELAIRARELFGSKKPIAFFDTESGSDYLVDIITDRTGLKPVRVKTRAFVDLMTVVDECEAGASDILIVDSITHVWRELNDAYMEALNKKLKYPKTRMTIDDIMQVKAQWAPWPNAFLNSKVHIIVCGREGNEWGNEEDEETGKRELVAVGKKMKVEGEFGYEASLQVVMTARQIAETVVKKKGATKSTPQREHRARRIINVATVVKDRFDVMNGSMFEMPTGANFDPFLKRLRPQLHGQVNTSIKSDNEIDVDDAGFAREKRQRTRWAEEIQGLLVKHYPGQTAADKAAKADLLEEFFKSRSWSYIEGFPSNDLRAGYMSMKRKLEPDAPAVADVVIPEPAGEAAEMTS